MTHNLSAAVRLAALLLALLSASMPVMSAPPAVDIASTPPFGGSMIHPNILLALSIEFPTARNAYPGKERGAYHSRREYIGYFNTGKCYAYNSTHFEIAANAGTNFACGTSSAPFSGNFLNWATTSAIDSLRLALSGGNRFVDTDTTTILQRAYLPAPFYRGFFEWRTINGQAEIRAATGINANKIYISNCRDKMFISDALPMTNGFPDSSCDAPQKTVNGTPYEFLARVEVCNAVEGPERPELCMAYDKAYKPVGEMQRNAHKVRFGVMSYLVDDPEAPVIVGGNDPATHQSLFTSASRYGGVLRAPMKYIGARRFDNNTFTEADNPQMEWHLKTGVFIANPDNANGFTQSGAINYLNRFGSTGNYKVHDPVGELYYEGLRYLQGKQPTGATAANPLGTAYHGSTRSLDGFPAHQWKDPVLAACQRNYVLVIADAYSHYDWSIPGGRPAPAHSFGALGNPRPTARPLEANDPDVVAYTNKVGAFEHRANLASLTTGSNGHGSYYMSGLAYWANTTDIRQDKKVRVQTLIVDVDENGDGTLDSQRQPRSTQLYLAAKYGGFKDKNKDGNPFATTNGQGQTVHNDTEWSDNTKHKRPRTYFLASEPDKMLTGIQDVFSFISSNNGALSGSTASNTLMTSSQSKSYIFQSGYETPEWFGTLRKREVHRSNNGTISIATTALWEAGELLTKKSPDERRIFVGQRDDSGTFGSTTFLWSNLNQAQKNLLHQVPYAHNKHDNLGEQRLDYLRGKRSDNDRFRTQPYVLGDIVNSAPVFVGAASSQIQDANYHTFYTASLKRKHAIYVGANDGMLHAFDETNGNELFAYIPDAVVKDLGKLTSRQYVHQSYVDGGITVGEAMTANQQWKSVLVSGMGGKTRGVFALDVTDPVNMPGSPALWEFTDRDDADIGHVVGMPAIAKFTTHIAQNGTPTYRYFAVVSSGLNNYVNDNSNNNANGDGFIFLLALDKKPATQWVLGNNYFKWKAPIQNPQRPNSLGAPTIVTSAQGAVDVIYAGDLQGNVWRFDFSRVARNLSMAQLINNTSHRRILFSARDNRNIPQPVTTRPKVVYGSDGGYMVLFGTGKNIELHDASASTFSTQTFYALLDNRTSSIPGRQALQVRTAEPVNGGEHLLIKGAHFTYGSTANTKRGWYLDFPSSMTTGERSVTEAATLYGTVFFNTLIPARDLCSTGSGRQYQLDLLTGLTTLNRPTGALSHIGILSAPIIIESQSNTSNPDPTGGTTTEKWVNNISFGSDGGYGTGTNTPGYMPNAPERLSPQDTGRLSWREIINWQELGHRTQP